jgi:Zn-dependent protease
LDLEAAILNVSLLWLLTTPHEFAHAWAAIKLGDDTPKLEGRNTLHPLAHVDWIGTLLLPAITSLMGAGFLGWGKPVNTNPARLRGGMNGLALVALAGPASNVIFAVILALVAVLCGDFLASAGGVLASLPQYFAHGVYLSLYLAIFNMIPVPPLDGSKLLLAARIPPVIYMELARFGFLLVLVAFALTDLGYRMSGWATGGATAIFRVLSS